MVALEDFSRIVGSIYAAATEHDWTRPLAEVSRAVEATSADLLAAGGEAPSRRAIDHLLAEVGRGPVGLVRDLDGGLFVRLTGATQPTCLLVTAPSRSGSFATSQRVDFVNALVPHWQQALRIHDRFPGPDRADAEIADVVDVMRSGVVVIDADRSILHINLAAARLLRADDGLRVRSASLLATRPSTDADLQRGIDRAVHCLDRGHRGGTTMTCPRPSGAWPYIVDLVPLGRDDQGRALVVVVDPDDRPWPATARIRHIFGMTGSEAEVAVRILNGDGLKPISEELSLSMATVKTHLQHVFDKTATHRQAELVRLLLSTIP